MTKPLPNPPDWQPILVGDTVILRPMTVDDRKEMTLAASDPLIWALHPASDRHKEPVFRQMFDEGLATRSAVTIIERSTGAIIGSSRWHGHDVTADEIEIGWTFLIRRHWGGATNREVKRLMIDHAHRYVGCAIFKVGATNWRSRGAMEKIGGRLRPGEIQVPLGDRTVPYVVYEIRRGHTFCMA